MEGIEVGASVYVLVLSNPAPSPGGPCNAANYQAIQSTVSGVSDSQVTVTTAEGQTIQVPEDQVFTSELPAQDAKYRVAFEQTREYCAYLIMSDLPENLMPNLQNKISTNPLRFAERNIVQPLVTNTVPAQVNVQKVIQIIGMTLEDIGILISVLDVILFTSDYVKKLIAKYVLIEFSNLYVLLAGSGDKKGLRHFSSAYANDEFIVFKKDLEALNVKYGFRNIRNALGSHKDSTLNLQEYVDMWNKIDSKAINEYWEALSKHIDTVLIKYWPMDRLLLLANAGQSLVGIGIGPKNAGYVPFNDVEM